MPETCRVLIQNKIGIISAPGWLFKKKTFRRVRKNCEKRLLASSCLSVRPSVGDLEENTTRVFTPQTLERVRYSLRHPINP